MTDTMQRVWIELDPPYAKGKPADHALGHKRAAQLTAMFARLMAPGDKPPVFRWNESRVQYDKIDGPMSIQGMADSGAWFNLDYLGRDADQEPTQ
jgi:hypothetical protein